MGRWGKSYDNYYGPPAAGVKNVRRICRCCRQPKAIPTTRYRWPDNTAICDDCWHRGGPPPELFSDEENKLLDAAVGRGQFNVSPHFRRALGSTAADFNDRIPDFRDLPVEELQVGRLDYWSI